MPTKNYIKKVNLRQSIKGKKEGRDDKNNEEEEAIPIKKEKIKPIEIEDIEAVVEVEDKVVDEVPLADGEPEEDEEAAGLIDEDLDPFGDKWEQ